MKDMCTGKLALMIPLHTLNYQFCLIYLYSHKPKYNGTETYTNKLT